MEQESIDREQEHPVTIYHAAIYLVDRAYGGPEEGGWWYTYGTPVLDEPFPHPILTHTENEAIAAADLLDKWLIDNEINKGRRDIGSVLSTGQYQAIWDDGLPAPFPKERPHYE